MRSLMHGRAPGSIAASRRSRGSASCRAPLSRSQVQVEATASGNSQAPQQGQQYQPPNRGQQVPSQQPSMQGGVQMRGGPQQPSTLSALVRRPAVPSPQPVSLEQSQVLGKQVITCNTGRSLGVASFMWVDPTKAEVVSLDLVDKKGGKGSNNRSANIPFSVINQIGDVILVDDESAMYQQPLDGRYGFLVLSGMEVKTRSGDFLGKVRDFSFSPDTGTISRIVYDDFGLSFLPVNFFDTFSVNLSKVLSFGPGGIIVTDESKYSEQRETSGLFALIPSLFRSMSNSAPGSAGSSAGALTDGGGYGRGGALPEGYSYNQWEEDVRRWEMETGLSYNQYTASQGGSQLRYLGSSPTVAAPAAPLRTPRRLGPGAGPSPQPQFSGRPGQQFSRGAAAPAGGSYPPAGGYTPQSYPQPQQRAPRASPAGSPAPSPSSNPYPYQPQPADQRDSRPPSRGYSSTANQPQRQQQPGGNQPGSRSQNPPSAASMSSPQSFQPSPASSSGVQYDSWMSSTGKGSKAQWMSSDGDSFKSVSLATGWPERSPSPSSWEGYYKD
eukprot:gene23096-30293_t